MLTTSIPLRHCALKPHAVLYCLGDKRENRGAFVPCFLSVTVTKTKSPALVRLPNACMVGRAMTT